MALRSIALFMLLGVRRVALTIAGLSPRAANCINPSEADYQDSMKTAYVFSGCAAIRLPRRNSFMQTCDMLLPLRCAPAGPASGR